MNGPRSTPSLPERMLRALADVRAGEGHNAVLMFVNIFVLLTAYYVLKSVRDGLMIGGTRLVISGTLIQGDQLKIYAASLMTVLLLGIVPAYSWFASRVSRVRLINVCVALVIACLVLFWMWGSASGAGLTIGLSFYVWLGIVNVFLIAQFWSFANDVYTKEQGERLFAVVALGQSLGAIFGGLIVSNVKISIFVMLGVSAVLLAICLILYNVLDRRFTMRRLVVAPATETRQSSSDPPEASEAPLSRDGAFKLVFRTKYLLFIALMLLCNNLVNTTGEYLLANAAQRYTTEQVPDAAVADAILEQVLDEEAFSEKRQEPAKERIEDARSQVGSGFYGRFYTWVNVAGTLIQAFLVSRIIKYLGVRIGLFFLPLIALGGYAAIGMLGGLVVLRVAKTAENSVDYSLQNTLKQAVFLVTSREAKYKAKVAIDTAFVRFGDVAAGILVLVGLHVLGLQTRGFALFNIATCGVWLLLTRGIAREHRKLELTTGARPAGEA